VAAKLGLSARQIKQHGLPVRPAFWEDAKPRVQLCAELGLEHDKKTVLIVGGGDGVGSLSKIVEATAEELGAKCPGTAQIVAVCGTNAKLQSELKAKSAEWSNVNVEVRGFVRQMSDFMECADVMVTKAGPGTIAEATIRGLPTMLSSFLPGQEAGNVPFVTQNGFGSYSKNPKEIARRVTGWLEEPQTLRGMASAAKACSAPHATNEIALDLLAMMDAAARAPASAMASAPVLARG